MAVPAVLVLGFVRNQAVQSFVSIAFFAFTAVIVVDTALLLLTLGAYAYVRHPMYAGALGFLLGAPLMLGSWWGLAAALLLVLAMAVRAVLEERAIFGSHAMVERFVPGRELTCAVIGDRALGVAGAQVAVSAYRDLIGAIVVPPLAIAPIAAEPSAEVPVAVAP